MNNGAYEIHTAIVHTSDVVTGDATVRIPALLGAGAIVSVPTTGLTYTSNEWNVPVAGSSVFVAVSPDRTRFLWLTGAVAATDAASGGGGSGGSNTKYTETLLGNATDTDFTVTHNLNTRDVVASVHDLSSVNREIINVDIIIVDNNSIQIQFDSPPTATPQESFRVVVIA